MGKKIRPFLTIRILQITLLVAVCSPVVVAQKSPGVVNGILDLSQANIASGWTKKLTGYWAFYPHKLLTPEETKDISPAAYVHMPYDWKKEYGSSFGTGTFVLDVLLPDSTALLAISIPDLYTAYTLFADDKVIAKNGIVADSEEKYTPYWLPLTAMIPPNRDNKVRLTLQIANYRHFRGGSRLPLIIGEQETLIKKQNYEIAYAFGLGTTIFIGGIFFIGLYLFGGNEYSILLFAIFCIAYSYRILGTEAYALHLVFPSLPWWLTVRLEYLSLYLSAVVFGCFIDSVFPNETNKKLIYLFSGISGLFALTPIVLPVVYFSQLLSPFLYFVPFFIAYSEWVFIKALVNKRPGAIFAFLSTLSLFTSFLHDYLAFYGVTERNLALSFFTLLGFFLLQAKLLAYRMTYNLKAEKARAEAATEAKSLFLSTMSHEIRTPLNSIIGLSELMQHSKTKSEMFDFARTIKSSGENLLSILNNILDYSKMEIKDWILSTTNLRLHAFLTDFESVISPVAKNKRLEFRTDFDPKLPEIVECDPVRLHQVLYNLVGNALKFTEEGYVKLTVELLSETESAADIEFRVDDTGPGIPPDKVHLIFKEFSQLDASKTRKEGGTGLGLAISKKIVEQMGGTVSFRANAEKGACFYFKIQFPKISKESVNEEESKAHIPEENIVKEAFKKADILLVEDNKVNQIVAKKMLERIGISKIHIAENGLQAIEMSKKKQYQMILMDMEMPEMDGVDAAKHIRKQCPKNSATPIIALTANVTPEDRQRCAHAGMNDFTGKPITLENLLTIIQKWIGHKDS